ncbi:TonB-dependent receptor [Hymenobacter taeanensis]|uniref:TonB-dependent receptor n=1 Tax=Hymenobacter taeanensis TaxID=2735321 RepID=A0A6M6BH98_9BACT|nr:MULTISPECIES: TonB-dependent receptor [Hymenobacter]QJX47577.1 TonB-dependent receptor [Hymenobacter taeanensis]UOQ82940.1 TonB-dependent receptor [Hymenobacter sp. 5414T-23]
MLTGTAVVAQQVSLQGRVREAGKGQPVSGCEVYVRGSRQIARTDSAGVFTLNRLAPGRLQLQLSSIGHEPLRTEVKVSAEGGEVDFELTRRERQLREVVVAAQQTKFGQTRLREVEGTAIFAAKKSEVIIPDNLVANLATNNARQVYSRVAGLNIWESDQGGLQLSIGGRGLDPNRTANFNVRQNGYDISADALGYPESYYTPPTEAIKRIQLVRGAASLQYGTQFGGLLNFELRQPEPDKTVSVVSRQSVGSYGFFNSFNSVSGTVKKLSYYGFAQYKRGDGWRLNSHFDSKTAYADVRYQLTENLKLGGQFTHMDYLAQQPGGLSDRQFARDARQSNRARNWFDVDWNLFNLSADWKLNPRANINLTTFALVASRKSLGYRPNFVERADDDTQLRDLISGQFRNVGLEARYLNRYGLGDSKSGVLLVGTRLYRGYSHNVQGFGPAGRKADFRFVDPSEGLSSQSSYSDYRFPNYNAALFAENIFYFGEKFSLTPGLRYEYIRTRAEGSYGSVERDLANNIIASNTYREQRTSPRGFVIGGLGASFKPVEQREFYANISQNYRSITFSDMQLANNSLVIDPNLRDERGYSADLGLRGEQEQWLTYDLSLFALRYNNRIGEVQTFDANDRILRFRGNIGRALILGVESYAEVDMLQRLNLATGSDRWRWSTFGNVALIRSRYTASQNKQVVGKQVEFVPSVNLKAGMQGGFGPFKASVQFTYLSDQFSEATNAPNSPQDRLPDANSAVVGLIPAYHIWDASLLWERRWLKLEASVNNLSNTIYFTRRATGYPGPGILPSDPRSFFLTAAVKW